MNYRSEVNPMPNIVGMTEGPKSTIERIPAVMVSLNALHDNLTALENRIDSLVKRIQPICDQIENVKEPAKDKLPASVPLCGTIDQMTDRLRKLNDKVGLALDTIQL